MACSNDPTCEMVMDRHCDEQGYELCSTTKLCSSAEGTCSFTRLSGDFDEIEGNQYSVVQSTSCISSVFYYKISD